MASTQSYALFGCGSGGYGQQGSGDTTSRVTTFTQRLAGETIKSVACSADMTWAVTTDGKLFGCGYNGYGTQGDGTSGGANNVLTFTQRLAGETIKDAACAVGSTWAVTTDGKLFGCGRNNTGQQGSGDTNNVLTFTQRLAGETIEKVVCSESTIWAITSDGRLFGCGRSDYGQQGSGDTNNVLTFTQRLAGETIKDVACSRQTTWVVTTDGKLFGCGDGSMGQQGTGTWTSQITTFTQRLAGENIKSVACSDSTTWVVTTDGKLFGCGNDSYGQQGGGKTSTGVRAFTQRLAGETIKDVACSRSTTWAITSDGRLFGCGRNNTGQQGSGDTNNVLTFTQRLAGETIEKVVCILDYSDATWAVTTDGKLFGCGYNSKGQQGSGDTNNVLTFTQRLNDYKIAIVACTLETTWALSPIQTIATTNVKVNGAWTQGSVYIKVDGQWVESKKIYVKVNGNWVEGS